MTIYVDNMRAHVGRLIMCHMIAGAAPDWRPAAARFGAPGPKTEEAEDDE